MDLSERLGVCSWSLQPETPQDLIEKLKQTGIRKVQLALDPLRENPKWANAQAELQAAGITILSGMFGCAGEDYTTLETIKQTGGIAPDSTWNQNWANIQATAALAERLGLKLVTFHAGFLPHNESDPGFKKLLDRLRQVADLFAARAITLGLETGQETADALVQMLKKLGHTAVRVNFDPANMILYGKGNPIEALRTLGPWICQVHIKDATSTKVSGTWGAEVPAGTGEVDWRAFFGTLREIKFAGNCVIEREAGQQRVTDIQTARRMVEAINS